MNFHSVKKFAPILAVTLSGCVYHVAYNPSYLPSPPSFPDPLPGKAMLYTSPSDDAYTFKGRPSSFTGGGSQLEIPLGMMSKQIAQNILNRLFAGNCAPNNTMQNPADYTAVIHPRVISFDYKYNRMRNLDFATTPQVNISVQVNLHDQTGNVFFSKTYSSGTFSGKTVMDTLKPGELINKTTHEALSLLYNQAAGDIDQTLRARKTTAPPVQTEPVPAAKPADALPENKNSSNAERLQELKRLYEQGLISKEAYDKKQQEILDSL